MTLINGNCLEEMRKLEDKSIDLMICDLPYGETNCKWDIKIDMEQFWKEFKRVRKSPRTACIHFCSTKFGYELIKSWEKGFKMDMVWKKRNKTGGLQSRNRPMRNHEMVYFFYDQAPMYNRDKYHKRINPKNETINNVVGNITNAGNPEGASNFTNGNNGKFFEPPNPVSVIEPSDANKATIYKDRIKGNKDPLGFDAEFKKNLPFKHQFEPPNPTSVLEQMDEFGWSTGKLPKENRGKEGFEPKLPASVVEEDEPVTMFESTKVFIGKRHHQTEKPQDILEFFLKYWSNEGDIILDPTMGSGSTGVAAKNLNRNFIGIELDEGYFNIAKERIENA